MYNTFKVWNLWVVRSCSRPRCTVQTGNDYIQSQVQNSHKTTRCLTDCQDVSSSKWFDGSLFTSLLGRGMLQWSTKRKSENIQKEHFPCNQTILMRKMIIKTSPIVPIVCSISNKNFYLCHRNKLKFPTVFLSHWVFQTEVFFVKSLKTHVVKCSAFCIRLNAMSSQPSLSFNS